MFKPVKFINLVLTIGLMLVVLAHVIGLISIATITKFEQQIYDVQLSHAMPGGVDPNVAIANIDDKSLKELGQWPWRRDVLAQLINTLFDHYEIKALGFDMVFSEPSDNTATDVLELLASSDLQEHSTFQSAYNQLKPQIDFDQQFTDALNGRNVVLGIVFERSQKDVVNQLPLYSMTLPEDAMAQNTLVDARSFVTNLPQLHQATTFSGYFDNPLLDDDGVFRRVPMVQRFQQYVYPSLALQLAQLALDGPKFSMEFEPVLGEYTIDRIQLGDTNVPVAGNGALLVPYRGEQASFHYFSIYELLTKQIDKNLVQGKTILVGTDAAGLLDLRTTPFAKGYPGVEVHANIVSGILEGRVKSPLRDPDAYLIISIILCSVLLFVLTQLKDVRVQLGCFVVLIVLIASGRVYFWQQGVVLPIAELLSLVIALFVSLTLVNSMQEAKQKRGIAKMFSQYIPPEIVREMSKSPDKYQLTSQTKELTVLFCDIRSFTSISERLSADELSELMNLYLSRMTHVIHQHNGTIDKYMGDAIMAFWGAPLDNPNHAKDAVAAARSMHLELDSLNTELDAKGWPKLQMGIGLNTGDMFVGNMGSDFRMAYTVMGDAVNLAARLESLTKQYGVICLISQSTSLAADCNDMDVQELDLVRVKGKLEPVAIYQLLVAGENKLDEFDVFLQNYRQQDWTGAQTYLPKWRSANLALADLYNRRLINYLTEPPEGEWDGVYTHDTK